MVGLQTLDLPIGVRIPVSQPIFSFQAPQNLIKFDEMACVQPLLKAKLGV